MKALALKVLDALNPYPLFHAFTADTAAVFMLHRFTPEPVAGAISTGQLREYLRYLRDHRYRVVSLAAYIEALRSHAHTRKTVVFTVDDGNRDFYLHAYPVFREFGYPATVFVTSDFVDDRLFLWWYRIEFALRTTAKREIDLGFMGRGTAGIAMPEERSRIASLVTEHCKRIENSAKLRLIDQLLVDLDVDTSGQPRDEYEPSRWEDLLEMQEHGIDFHPHTKTHPILTQIGRDEKLMEVATSRGVIEARLGRKADIFCYPNGGPQDFDDEAIACLREAGYRAAVTGIPGFDDTRGETDLYRLRRQAIPHEAAYFRQYVSGMERAKDRVRSWLKR
jgi:peptidoglycan/xylan/chitin deacetylase (PgdA/CDA1 family)